MKGGEWTPARAALVAVQIKRHGRHHVPLAPDGSDLLLTMDALRRPVPKPQLVAAIGQAFARRAALLKTGGTFEALATEVNQYVSALKQRLHLS